MKRRRFIRDATLAFGAISIIPKSLKAWTKQGGLYVPPTYPIVPTEAQFKAALGGSWTNETTFTYNSTNNLTFTRKIIDGTKLLANSCDNIVFRYCIFKNVTTDRAAAIQFSDSVEFDHCYFENNATHIYINANNDAATGNWWIHECVFKNALGPFPLGQCIQFNLVNNTGGNIIENNYMYNRYDEGSDQEDMINMHQSTFPSGDPCLIRNNYLNGIGIDTTSGPSASSGGILLSDDLGSYVNATGNVVIYPGQYGMGIASGSNCNISNNKIYQPSRPLLPSNVGIYVYDAGHHSTCTANSVTNNNVNYLPTGSFLPGTFGAPNWGCTSTTSTGNNFADTSITDQEPPQAPTLWWVTSPSAPGSTIRVKSRVKII